MNRVGSAVGGARASFIRAVLADEQPTRQRVGVRGKADRVSVAIAPRERLDRLFRMCRVELGTQDRAIANTAVLGAFKGFHGRAWPRRAEGRIPTGFSPRLRSRTHCRSARY